MTIEQINEAERITKRYLRKLPKCYKERVVVSDLAIDALISIHEAGYGDKYSEEDIFRHVGFVFSKEQKQILGSDPRLRASLDSIRREYKDRNRDEINKRHKESVYKYKPMKCEGRTIDYCYYHPMGGRPIYFFKK